MKSLDEVGLLSIDRAQNLALCHIELQQGLGKMHVAGKEHRAPRCRPDEHGGFVDVSKPAR